MLARETVSADTNEIKTYVNINLISDKTNELK